MTSEGINPAPHEEREDQAAREIYDKNLRDIINDLNKATDPKERERLVREANRLVDEYYHPEPKAKQE